MLVAISHVVTLAVGIGWGFIVVREWGMVGVPAGLGFIEGAARAHESSLSALQLRHLQKILLLACPWEKPFGTAVLQFALWDVSARHIQMRGVN